MLQVLGQKHSVAGGLGKNRDRSEESFELLPTQLALGTIAEQPAVFS
jgi:hypothetical protein